MKLDSLKHYEECNGNSLKGPNDIVFDKEGNFWFTDLENKERDMDRAQFVGQKSDGSLIKEVIHPVNLQTGLTFHLMNKFFTLQKQKVVSYMDLI